MGARGPKPKTPQQKALDGNPGRRPDAKPAIGFAQGAPQRPQWLIPLAVEVWDELLPQLTAAGVLSPVDRNAFGSYCQCVARYIEAEQFMTNEGTVAEIRNDKGEVKQQLPVAEFTIALKYLEKANQLGERFGLTPVSRRNFSTGAPQQSALEAFLNQAND